MCSAVASSDFLEFSFSRGDSLESKIIPWNHVINHLIHCGLLYLQPMAGGGVQFFEGRQTALITSSGRPPSPASRRRRIYCVALEITTNTMTFHLSLDILVSSTVQIHSMNKASGKSAHQQCSSSFITVQYKHHRFLSLCRFRVRCSGELGGGGRQLSRAELSFLPERLSQSHPDR